MLELFRVLLAKNCFRLVLVPQLFQPASNWAEMAEKTLVATTVVFTALIDATCVIKNCVISCAICTAHMMLLVNKKDGIRVAHPLIHFYDNF